VTLAVIVLDQLENILRRVLEWLGPHGAIGLPWAWAIVALTVIVRILIVPLTVKQIHSMQNLQRFAPQMKEIQQKYKGDKQKQNEELMKFYREHKINPAASCLPMLAQLPVFISLYLVLKHAPYQHADDLGWLGLINLKAHATTGWGPLLIGKRGKTIDAIQYIVGAAVASAGDDAPPRVSVDAAGYRDRRESRLVDQAERSAAQAIRTGDAVRLEPMSSTERKIVHLHLKDVDGVETHSEGDEPNRYVVVSPVG